MEIQKRLLDLKERQHKILEEYENLVRDYDSNGLVNHRVLY